MSSRAQHFSAGFGLGVFLGLGVRVLSDSPHGLLNALAIFAGSVGGSSLPDSMEISWHTGGGIKRGFWRNTYIDGQRHSLIPHRRITHWLLAWTFAAVFGAAWVLREPHWFGYFLAGLAMSGWLHCLMDSRTPMGVPWFHPWRRIRGSATKKGGSI